jgi:hypothetical protein
LPKKLQKSKTKNNLDLFNHVFWGVSRRGESENTIFFNIETIYQVIFLYNNLALALALSFCHFFVFLFLASDSDPPAYTYIHGAG